MKREEPVLSAVRVPTPTAQPSLTLPQPRRRHHHLCPFAPCSNDVDLRILQSGVVPQSRTRVRSLLPARTARCSRALLQAAARRLVITASSRRRHHQRRK
ncbi:hypothetical protein M0R45_016902 [Rubus argutus]|uniref:Uncharacterized protein n=1 Tax=Rubus argutus TaxID=59490 RepID=A0AAW1XXH5_RUBAR